MVLAKLLARQLGNPSRIVGNLAAFLWNKRNTALNDVAFDHLALNPNDRVLEVGFGGGYLLGRMSSVVTKGFLSGVDVSEAMVAFCKRRYRSFMRDGKFELRRGRAESLPYPGERFTKICTVNSIFYWRSVQQALSEFSCILANSGSLVLCFTLKTSLEKRGFAKHLSLYEAGEIQGMMESCGFQGIRAMRFSDRHRAFVCITGRKQSRPEAGPVGN